MQLRHSYRPYAIHPATTTQVLQPGRQYFCPAARETCLVRDELYCSWIIDHGLTRFIDVPNGKVYDYYLDEKTALATLQALAAFMERHWNAHLQRYDVQRKRLVRAATAVSRAVGMNRKTLLARYRDHLQAGYDFGEFIWGPWAVIYCVEKELTQHVSPEQMALIGSLDRPVAFFRMQRDLFRLPAKQLVSRYGWLHVYSPYDAPFSEQYFRQQRALVRKSEIEKIFANYPNVQRAFQKLQKNLRPAHVRRLAVMMHRYAFLKTDRIDEWRKSMYALIPFCRFLAKHLPGATLRDVTNMSVQETITLLSTGHAPSVHDLRLRSANKALYLMQRGRIQVVTEQSTISNTLLRLEGLQKKLQRFSGIVACSGIARGRARIISHSTDLAKIRPGDIFVAKYTFPTFTPAMLKSKAIVTDEGGLTSHAAVIAREYSKPCIVGTKIATQVLKDGDLVEVDANTGIVRKLQR